MVEKVKNLWKKPFVLNFTKLCEYSVYSVRFVYSAEIVYALYSVHSAYSYSVNRVSSVNIALLLRCVYNIFSAYMLCYAFSVYRMLISDKQISPTITHTVKCVQQVQFLQCL